MGIGRCRGITRRWRGELRVGFAFREQGHGKEGEVRKKEDALWVLSEVSGLPPQKIRQQVKQHSELADRIVMSLAGY